MNIRLRFSKILMLGVARTSLPLTAAFAGHSAWLLGDDGKVAVNIFEHRASMGRATEVTLIYGRFFLHGQLRGTDAGKIILASPDYTFTGMVSINYEKSQLILKGKMTDSTAGHAEVEKFDTTIRCKRLGD